jgi:hypothetical protein
MAGGIASKPKPLGTGASVAGINRVKAETTKQPTHMEFILHKKL